MLANKIKECRSYFGVFLLGVIYATVSNLVYTYPNEDSALYLATAAAIQSDGFSVAFDWFSWPFYSALLACLSKLFSLDLVFVAKALNVVLYGAILVLFYNLCRIVTASRAAAIWALLALLSSAKFFEYGSFFVRDIAYWAGLLLTFYYSCRFVDRHRPAYLSWAIAGAVIAFFFKPEAVFYQIPLLAYLLVVATPKGKRHFIMKALVPVVLIVIAIVFLSDRITGLVSEGFAEQFGDKVIHFIDDFNQRNAAVAWGLGRYLAEFSAVGLVVTALIAVISKLVKLVGVVPVGWLAYAHFRRLDLSIETHKKRLVLLFGMLSLALPVLNVLSVMVIDYRYLIPATFVILPFFGLAMTRLPGGVWRRGEKSWLVYITVLLLAVNFALRLNYPKDYYPALSAWASGHQLDADTRFNNNQIGFIVLGRAVNLDEIAVANSKLQVCDQASLRNWNWVIYMAKTDLAIRKCVRQAQQWGLFKTRFEVSSNQGETVIVTEKIR